MQYLVIRHGKAGGTRLNRPLFGKAGAPLVEAGYEQAGLLGATLAAKGIDPGTAQAAVSTFIRTRQTALAAGFKAANLHVSGLLDEISSPDPQQTVELIAHRQLPAEALAAAEALLKHPPQEPIWFTHGLLIAGLRAALGLPGFIPDFCEVVELQL